MESYLTGLTELITIVLAVWGSAIPPTRPLHRICFAASGFVGLIAIICSTAVDHGKEQKEALDANPAGLEPDNRPSPSRICAGKDEANVILGGSAYGSSHFPFVAIHALGQDLLTIDRDSVGKIYVSFEINDSAGHLIAMVVRNQVLVLPHFANRLPRTDLHGLQVVDDYGHSLLNIDYINKNTISVTGRSTNPGFA